MFDMVVRFPSATSSPHLCFWRVSNLAFQPHVIIREFTHLGIVDPQYLGLLVDANAEVGDEMHDPEDDGGHAEGIGETGDGVGELIAELNVVVVDPASWNFEAIEGGDARLGEQGGEEVANDTTDTVRSEDL